MLKIEGIMHIFSEINNVFTAIFIVMMMVTHIFFTFKVNYIQNILISKNGKCSNISFFSSKILNRIQVLFFMINIFDFKFNDLEYKFYVMLWRISGFAFIAGLFLLFSGS